MRIVLVNGCFDVLHPGHVAHLQEARAMGDYLVVGLTSDECVNKPGRPIQAWEERAFMLRALRVGAHVLRCGSAVEAILHVQPSVFVKGHDYCDALLPQELSACQKVKARVAFTSPRYHSTTALIDRIQCASS